MHPGPSSSTAAPPSGSNQADVGSWLLLVLAGLLLVLRAIYLGDRHLVVDDSFISYRYAQNLAEGHGLVFNLGERVEGYTNFLWTLLLAAAAGMGVDLVRFSQVLGTVASLGTMVLLVPTGRRLLAAGWAGSGLAVLPALLFAAMGSQGRLAVSGMETPLFVFLVLLAVHLLFVADRPGWAGVAFALATMTRPEGGLYWLIALALVTAGAVRASAGHRRWVGFGRPALLGTSFTLLYGPYFLWRFLYYGYLLPNTFYAKVGDFGRERLVRGWGMLAELVVDWGVLPLLFLALLATTSRRGRRSGLPLWSYVIATSAYFVAVGGDLVVFFGPRFLMPALPMLLLLATLGLQSLTAALPRRLTRPVLVSAAAGLVVYCLVWTWPARFDRLEWLALEMEGWEEVAGWVRTQTPPDALVAVGAAGIVPYYSGRPTLDMYGLVDETIAHLPPRETGFVRVAHEKFAPWYVMQRRPEVIVTYLTPDGQPATAGLARLGRRLFRCYRWRLLIRVAAGSPADAPWLVPVEAFSPVLYERGYRAAVLERVAGGRCPG